MKMKTFAIYFATSYEFHHFQSYYSSLALGTSC